MGSTRSATEVPFVDLGLTHGDLKARLLEDLSRLVDGGRFTNGPAVAEFEAAFAAYCGAQRCVGVGSGLDALRLTLIASGLEPGDEVIVPALTFVATAEAVSQAGGVPILADADERTYCIDAEAVAAAVTERTRFCMPVHLYGQLADMGALQRVADERGFELIEDACQAHGASRDGVRPGELSVAAAYSFYPAKNLGAFGDAGAVTTSDAQVADRIAMLREHGQDGKYRHALPGWTSRLDTIHALVLLRKLELLAEWNEQRRAAARYYGEALNGVGDLVLPAVPEGSEHVWHLFVIRTTGPEELAAFLGARGIETGRHYPEPIHLTRAYEQLGYPRGSFPVSEQVARECLSLPVYPGIAEEQLEAVVIGVKEYFAG